MSDQPLPDLPSDLEFPPIDAAELAMRQRLIVNLRTELHGKCAAICGLSQLLKEDVESNDGPESLVNQIDQIRDATGKLYRMVRTLLIETAPEVSTPKFADMLKVARHSFFNSLNRVKGLTQLLILEQGEEHFDAFSDDLAQILSTCDQTITILSRYKDHEGSIAFESTGSDIGRPQISIPETPDDRLPTRRATVLVVDDQDENRQMLRRFLERQGHRVVMAAGGREALDMIEQNADFDLALIDLLMPEINGHQLLTRLKSDPRTTNLPVIIVSGLAEPQDIVTSISAGADDHLPKPVDFDLLQARVDTCLEKRDLRERELSQFFTPKLARHFLRYPEAIQRGIETEITVLFCDVRGFSSVSERLGPTETVTWLGDVMTTLSECVLNHDGVLVDFIGDELMAMWGAPEQIPDHADRACMAALEMLQSLELINSRWRDRIAVETRIGIGMNTGVARIGNTGSSRKFKYGPLGNTVNLASRIQGATKHLRTPLLVSESTFNDLKSQFLSRRLSSVRVVNIEKPVNLYEIRTTESDEHELFFEQYEDALRDYEDRQLTRAATRLSSLLMSHSDDGPSLLLMSRIVSALLDRETFSSVFELSSK